MSVCDSSSIVKYCFVLQVGHMRYTFCPSNKYKFSFQWVVSWHNIHSGSTKYQDKLQTTYQLTEEGLILLLI